MIKVRHSLLERVLKKEILMITYYINVNNLLRIYIIILSYFLTGKDFFRKLNLEKKFFGSSLYQITKLDTHIIKNWIIEIKKSTRITFTTKFNLNLEQQYY